MDKYLETYTSYTGSDSVTFINGNPIGEVSTVIWNGDINNLGQFVNMKGVISFIVLDKMPLEDYLTIPFEMEVRFLSEDTGKSKSYKFYNVRLTTYSGGIDINDIVEDGACGFEADLMEQV